MHRINHEKTQKKQIQKRSLRKTYNVFVEDNKMEAWTLLDRESQLYIAEDNKDADGSMDSIRRREPIICTHT
jgi:hypothetical protein